MGMAARVAHSAYKRKGYERSHGSPHHFLVADQVALSSMPAYSAVPFMVVGLSIVPLYVNESAVLFMLPKGADIEPVSDRSWQRLVVER